tara:strand:- start:1637 stop:1828 length:192 start_codon:yes stop_codon:yes gene_type:complete
MKNIGIILTALLLTTACSVKNPKLSFGKKCTVQGDEVVYSYVWVYNKNQGLEANEDNCSLIAE